MGRTVAGRLLGRGIILGFLLADVVYLGWAVFYQDRFEPTTTLVFAGIYASFAFVNLVLPRGDTLLCAGGVVVAAALSAGPYSASTATALGGAAALAIALRGGDADGLELDLVRQPVLAAIVGYLGQLVPLTTGPSATPIRTLAYFGVVAIAYGVADMFTYAAAAAIAKRERVLSSISSFARLTSGIYMGQVSVGVVMGFTLSAGGTLAAGLSGLILVALMLVMKHNFGLYLQIRSAYQRTVGVLVRLGEYENLETRGHSERVADLVTEIGRRLHVANKDLERLSLAALLHAVGRVTSDNTTEMGVSRAAAGARIARGVEFLKQVAPVVELHHCSASEAQASVDAWLGHIVGVACRFDQLVSRTQNALTDRQAILQLRSDAYEYDADVLEALAIVRGVDGR